MSTVQKSLSAINVQRNLREEQILTNTAVHSSSENISVNTAVTVQKATVSYKDTREFMEKRSLYVLLAPRPFLMCQTFKIMNWCVQDKIQTSVTFVIKHLIIFTH